MSEEELRAQIDVIDWEPLWRHYAFDRVRVCQNDLELLTAALALSEDRTDAVEGWIASGALARPTDAQVRSWSDATKTQFEMVVVRPFVLIRVLDN